MIFYRAMPLDVDSLRPGDYLTKSLRFAKEHAITTSLYHSEDYGVYRILLDASEVESASNVGEWLYKGVGKKAKLIGVAKFNEDFNDSTYISRRSNPTSTLLIPFAIGVLLGK